MKCSRRQSDMEIKEFVPDNICTGCFCLPAFVNKTTMSFFQHGTESAPASGWEPLDWRSPSPSLEPAEASPTSQPKSTKAKNRRRKKASEQNSDKPKRALSAYNLFFQYHRQQILGELPERELSERPRSSHGKINFADLARVISIRWRNITPQEKALFQQLSANDKVRYAREMEEWKQKKQQRLAKQEQVSFDETKLLDKSRLRHLAAALGDDCTIYLIQALR